MQKTKMRIVLAAIKLFNEQGLANVLNQDIAKAAEVSLSNFNYHFKTKRDLVHAVCFYMKTVLEERLASIHVLTSKGSGLDLSKTYFEFEKEFRFFYLDTHNILQTYPALQEEMQKQIQVSIQIIKNLHYLAIGMGHMQAEPPEMPGLYDHLAHQIWINSHFWLAQLQIRDIQENTVIKGLEAYFAICYPYLTEKGRVFYKNFIDKLKVSKGEIINSSH